MSLNKSVGHGNRWRGGKSITSHGYIVIKMPNHPRATTNGYVYEHILAAEKKLGRPLRLGEIVHHLDGNKQNNNEDNIMVVASIAAHKVHHRKIGINRRLPEEDNPTIYCRCGCGGKLKKYDDSGRSRQYLPGGHWRKGKTKYDRTIITECECGCGKTFPLYDEHRRPRRFVFGHFQTKGVIYGT